MGLTITTAGNEVDWVMLYSAGIYGTLPGRRFVTVESVPDMVTKINGCIGSLKIDRLIIIGHGDPGIQKVASNKDFNEDESKYISLDLLGLKTLNKSAEVNLPLLKNSFSKGARIELMGCQVAAGHHGELMIKRMSNILGVTVIGGVKDQLLIPGYEGEVITANGQHITKDEPSWSQ